MKLSSYVTSFTYGSPSMIKVSKLISEWHVQLENLAGFILRSAILLVAWSTLENKEIISALSTLKIKWNKYYMWSHSTNFMVFYNCKLFLYLTSSKKYAQKDGWLPNQLLLPWLNLLCESHCWWLIQLAKVRAKR